jgi:ABC-type lipoprotein export system ATPase subunit
MNNMSEQHTFAQFWKCALQVNPVGYSEAYRGASNGMTETEYNQALLHKCLELNIKVVGIADHGSVDKVDTLRQALQEHGIVVFPGFEIASTEKIHMVCLFAENTTIEQLNRYLGKLDLTDPEDTVWPSRLGCLELAEIIKQLGGFWYAAHATTANGILFLRSVHSWEKADLVRAAQIPGSVDDLPQEYKSIVLNSDPNYRRQRAIAVINARDVAKPDDLADQSATCWIKMTNPSFEAFKVAFLDPSSRIRLNSQLPEEPVSKILRFAVVGGYLDGLKVKFSEHLNAVIGGRGTGKSTLLECLRYVLDIPTKGAQAQKTHQEIIKINLGKAAGKIQVDIVSSAQHGKHYRISRRYGEAPLVREMHDGVVGDVSTLLPRDLLPKIEIYGHNEIYELAQDEQSRVSLLDRFMPQDNALVQRTAELRKALRENQQRLTKSLSDADDIQAQVALLPKLEEQLAGFKSLGIQEKLAKTRLFARERQIGQRATEERQQLGVALAVMQESLPDLAFIQDASLDGLPNAEYLIPIRKTLESLKRSFDIHLQAMQQELSNSDLQLTAQFSAWKQALKIGEDELDKALRALPAMSGKSGPEVGTAYQRILKDIERIKPMAARRGVLDKALAQHQQERLNLLGELSDVRGDHIGSLQLAAKKLNKLLKGKLKIEVVPEADRMPLKAFLIDSKLEGVGEKRLEWIDKSQSVKPIALADAIRKGADTLQSEFGMTPLVADALCKLPVSRLMELEALELAHRVDIFLNVSHVDSEPTYKPLSDLSTGQKCTAILLLLLLENLDPLIMDQPEDNLDNAFIADRIVQELRDAKGKRQFIFATHNANIPVFGDAEWIGVFTSVDNVGSMEYAAQGSIDVPVIRDQVANILEGGRDAFIQRKEKYEF